MRRTVWIVVLGLLVLAVVAQSVALVQNRRMDEFTDWRVEPDGRVIKIRTVPPCFGRRPIPRARARRASSMPDDQTVITSTIIESTMQATKELATKDALEQAQAWLIHTLGLSYAPAPEFIRARMKNFKDEPGKTVPEIGPTTKVSFELELTRAAWEELAATERDTLTMTRMGWLARLVAIFTVLLGSVAGYIRLDEYTKGYYTGRLRVLAVAVVAVATAALAQPH